MAAARARAQAELLPPPTSSGALGGGLDGFVLKDVLAPGECEALIKATEGMGFSFWNPASERRDYRNADTVEVTHQELADALCGAKACCAVRRAGRISTTVEAKRPSRSADKLGFAFVSNIHMHELCISISEIVNAFFLRARATGVECGHDFI